MPDPDLRPMLLMVCGPCAGARDDDHHTEGCVICDSRCVPVVPIASARTREEMLSAAAGALAQGRPEGYWLSGAGRRDATVALCRSRSHPRGGR